MLSLKRGRDGDAEQMERNPQGCREGGKAPVKPVKVSLRPFAPELKDLSAGALGAHVRALAWSCMHETDGELAASDIKAIGPTPAQLKELFDTRTWQRNEDGRVFVHYTNDNASRAKMQARRDASNRRSRRHRDREDTTDDATPCATPLHDPLLTPSQTALLASSPPLDPPDYSGLSGSSPESSSVSASDPKDLEASPRDSETRAKVKEVFECWKLEHNHPRAILDRRREAKVRQRLREGFTVEQLCRAVINAKKDEFLMGENKEGKRYDDLESLLRSASKVERLLEIKRNGHRPGNDNPPARTILRPTPPDPEAAKVSLEEQRQLALMAAGVGRRMPA